MLDTVLFDIGFPLVVIVGMIVFFTDIPKAIAERIKGHAPERKP